jgi:hypothetical protein
MSGLFFILGLISAAYPSADGALTALTASFCIDFLNFEHRPAWNENKKTQVRHLVHIGFALVLFSVIVCFRAINNEAVVKQLFRVANYTYGPLLGLFMFGIGSKRIIRDRLVPYICILSPCLCYLIDMNSKIWFSGYSFGNELLILNGTLTFLGLMTISYERRILR